MKIDEPTLIIFAEKYPGISIVEFLGFYTLVNELPSDCETPIQNIPLDMPKNT